MVLADIKLKLKIKPKMNKLPRFEVTKLNSKETRETYKVTIGGRFQPLLDIPDTDIGTEELWNDIKISVNETSNKLLGKKKPQQQKPWISDEVLKLSRQRSKLKLQRLEDASLKPKYNYLNREIKRKSKEDKDNWLRDLCREVDDTHEAKKTKQIYSTIKTITGTRTTTMSSVKDKNGKVLTEDNEVKDRWKESFEELFNKASPDDTSILQSIPAIPDEGEEPKILLDEVRLAIKHLKTGKAPGFDGISAEELKATDEPGVKIIHKLCNKIWDTGEIPQDWGRAVIVPIYKKKDKLDCSNYRGISLLSLAGKVFCSILHKRMQTRTEEILAESQAGFRPGRSTIDQLFTLRQIAEKYNEKRKPLYCCYIDYQKAFDTVWQEGLWQAMRHLGYLSKIVDLLGTLYGSSQSAVRVNGELTSWFSTMTGVRQGCILSPSSSTFC
jgi:hypothetical protein